MSAALETAKEVAETVVAVGVVAGLITKYILLPWLREHLIHPVKETNRQVTINGHTSETPTLLDKVDTLTTAAGAAATKAQAAENAAAAAAQSVILLGRLLEGQARAIEQIRTTQMEDRSE